MRFVFLVPSHSLAGGNRVVHIYATALAARGHEITVLMPAARVPTWRERFRRLRNGDPWRKPKATPSHFENANYRLTVLDKYRPIVASDLPPSDAVIATWFETAEWMLEMPNTVGIKIHFVQGYEAYTSEMKRRVDIVLSSPTAKVTISTWLSDLLRDNFGNVNVARVANGVDLTQFHAIKRNKSATFTVGILYSDSSVKNVGLGLSIFASLDKYASQNHLIAFGSHPERPRFKLPVNSTYQVNPPQNKIRDIYAQCDVWLCTSDSEGFYLPLLEAMACRCPVLSTPVGGPRDIIKDGINGFLFPFGDTAAAVERLLEIKAMSDAEWQAMSDNAYATACAHTWESASDQFEQALLDAIARVR
jgi:glycosyltransferase involved in cell wall biosynthesis